MSDDETPESGTQYSADEIHGHVLEAASEEMERPVLELSYSGLAAGLAIGFSFAATAFLTAHMSHENRHVAAAIAYPLGFIFVVSAAHQLFTENTLEPVIPLLEERSLDKLKKLLRLWAIVLPANLVGTLIFSFVVARTQAFDPALSQSFMDVARESTAGGAALVFYKGIWAGWLVALMAWVLASARDTTSQLVLIWLTTAPIAAFGFKHSIAGAGEAFYRVWLSDWTWADAWLSFELPALAGNIIGGVVLVAMVNHGQSSGSKKSNE